MKLMLYTVKNQKHSYKNIGYVGLKNGKRTNIKILSLGNSEQIEKLNENYKKVIDNIICDYDEKVNPELLKNLIMTSLNKPTYKNIKINAGVDVIEKFIDKLNLLKDFNYGKHKGMKEIIKYSMANKISNPSSILNSYYKRDLSGLDLDYSKNSFYRMLNLLLNNKNTLLKNIEKIRINNSTQEKMVFFDSTTLYFESFTRDGLRRPGYSKDGKFKEDQIVVGMACDINGIPIFYKVFPGNTSDVKTLIPFFNEFRELFPNKRMIVIADRGMSSAENTKYLESNNIDFIISYRAKASSKKFKEYLLDETGYQKINNILSYKERFMAVSHNRKSSISYKRKQVVTLSEKRKELDKLNREILINNFVKMQDSKGRVSEKQMVGYKKMKFFKQVKKSTYVLDIEKIEEDKKYDGLYVYETSLTEVSGIDIIDIYSNQWKIEENFRTLKNNLAIRPMYVFTDDHIEGHVLLCFTTLFVLKILLLMLKRFYDNYGILGKLTEDVIIKIFKDLNFIATTDLTTNKIIKKEKIDNNSFYESWDLYSNIQAFIKNI